MLLMKAWLETRWRFVFALVMLFLPVAATPPTARGGLLSLVGLILACVSLILAGSGVKSQAPIGFPEGLVGSTQFTITLPVTRLRLLSVRAGVGLLELSAVTAMVGCALWGVSPAIVAGTTPADWQRLLLVSVLLLTGPYLACTFFSAFLDEPLSFMCAGWAMALLLWIAHYLPPAVDIFAVWGQASPLTTHKLPWSQMAVSAGLATVLFSATVRCTQRREY